VATAKQHILVCEDDNVQREIIHDILEQVGYRVDAVGAGEEALARMADAPYHLLLTDLRMQGMNGIELLHEARRLRPETAVVVMTAYATVQTAVKAMKEGAVDYLAKPFDKDELVLTVSNAIARVSLEEENKSLRRLVGEATSLGNIVGQSAAMREVYQRVERATQIASTVLIMGESGTGKELIARHIHFHGPRGNEPFAVVNCAAIPDTLVESELFGHEKGAFTGAEVSRSGKFEAAHKGTLFLDEIGDMRLDAQAKLLRVLQDGVVERVGSTVPREVDVRVIAATNQDLGRRVQEGAFREDLYYRLEVIPIAIPPLRDRMDDLPLLIAHFRDKLGRKLGLTAPPRLSADAVEAIRRYRWPGNVRELEHTLEQLFVLATGETIEPEQLPAKLRAPEPVTGEITLPSGGLVLEDLEQELIRQALQRSGGRIKEAAELLGLSYKTLQYRLKKHEIDRAVAAEDAEA